MRLDGVVLIGSSSIPHPVLDRLFGGHLQPTKESDAGDVAGVKLVIVDARQAGNTLAPEGIAHRALEARIPLLVVAPSEGQLAPLAPAVGVLPRSAAQAVLFTPSSNEGERRRCEAKVLGYPLVGERKKRPSDEKPDQPPRPRRSGGNGDDTVLADYIVHIERRVERGYRPKQVDYPDGLKWVYTTWDHVQAFTYHTPSGSDPYFTNGQGSLTTFLEIRGFLDESTSGESTYLVTQGTYTVYPGSLASNDDEARGFFDLWFKNGIGPQGNWVPVNHIPGSGVDTWSDSFSITINYVDPLFGPKTYVYTASVAQTINAFSVQNSSAGYLQGSTWFLNSPLDGLAFPEDRSQAFTGSGHVEPFPASSTGTLTMYDASAWRMTGRFDGNLLFETDSWIDGAIIYAEACGALFCYDPNDDEYLYHMWPWFDVPFHFS
jgi:hypothetical protein